jgi:hypothetical protein
VHLLRNVILPPFVQTNAALIACNGIVLTGKEEAALGHFVGPQEVMLGMWPPAQVKTVNASLEVHVNRKADQPSVS